MKYIVKLKKTITLEYEMEVSDEMVDNVVDAMDLAEETMKGFFVEDDSVLKTESKWAVSSVKEEK